MTLQIINDYFEKFEVNMQEFRPKVIYYLYDYCKLKTEQLSRQIKMASLVHKLSKVEERSRKGGEGDLHRRNSSEVRTEQNRTEKRSYSSFSQVLPPPPTLLLAWLCSCVSFCCMP